MIPHYISEDMLGLLSANSTFSKLVMDVPLYSDRGNARLGEIITSPNAKAALWFTSTGDLQVWSVINPADFITNDPNAAVNGPSVVLTPPDKRYLLYSLFDSVPQAKTDLYQNTNLGEFSNLFVKPNGVEIRTSKGKVAKIFEWAPGLGFVELLVGDDGNLTVTRGGKPIWNLFSVIQPQTGSDSVGGFNLGSLLIPGIALAALLYLKK